MIERLLVILAVSAAVGAASWAWRRREGKFSEAGGAFKPAEIGVGRTKPSAVIVEFSGEHCGSCRIVEQRLAKLGAEIPEVRIVTVDADREPDLARRYDVKRVPTLFVTDPDLKIVWRATGVPSESAIKEALLGPDWAGRPHPVTPKKHTALRRRRRPVPLHEEGVSCEVTPER